MEEKKFLNDIEKSFLISLLLYQNLSDKPIQGWVLGFRFLNKSYFKNPPILQKFISDKSDNDNADNQSKEVEIFKNESSYLLAKNLHNISHREKTHSSTQN